MNYDAVGKPIGEDSDDAPSVSAPEKDSPVDDSSDEGKEDPEEIGREHDSSFPQETSEPPKRSLAVGGVMGIKGILEALIEGHHSQLNDDALRGSHDMLQYALKPGEPVPKIVPPNPAPKPEKLVSLGKTRKVTEEVLDIYGRSYRQVLGIDPETLGKRARNAALGDIEVHQCLDVTHDGEVEIYSVADPHRFEKRLMQLALELRERTPKPEHEPKPTSGPEPPAAQKELPRKRLNDLVCAAYMKIKKLEKPPVNETIRNNLKKVIEPKDVRDRVNEHGEKSKWYDVEGEENIDYVAKRSLEILSGKGEGKPPKPEELPQVYQLVQLEYKAITGQDMSQQKAGRLARKYSTVRGIKEKVAPGKRKSNDVLLPKSREDIPSLRENVNARLREEPSIDAILNPEPAPDPTPPPPDPEVPRKRLNELVCAAYMKANGLSEPPTRETIRNNIKKIIKPKDVRDRVTLHGEERKWYDVEGQENIGYVERRALEILSGKTKKDAPEPKPSPSPAPTPPPEPAPPPKSAPEPEKSLAQIVATARMQINGLKEPPPRYQIRDDSKKARCSQKLIEKLAPRGETRITYFAEGQNNIDDATAMAVEILKPEPEPASPPKKKGAPAAKPAAKGGGKPMPSWAMPAGKYIERNFPNMYERCRNADEKVARTEVIEADLYRNGHLQKQKQKLGGTKRWVDTRDENLEEYLGDVLFGRWGEGGEGGQPPAHTRTEDTPNKKTDESPEEPPDYETPPEKPEGKPYSLKGNDEKEIYEHLLTDSHSAFERMESTQKFNPGYDIDKISGDGSGKKPLVVILADGECDDEEADTFAANTFLQCLKAAGKSTSSESEFHVECNAGRVTITPYSMESMALLKAFRDYVLEQNTEE